MPRSIVTGIDIGTSSIRVIVSEYVKGKSTPQILGTAHKESRGLRHGYVVNADDAAESIKEAIREAEKSAKIKITNAMLSIGGESLGTLIGEASIAVSRADSEINDGDIKRAIETSQGNLRDLINRKILHVVPQSYKLDGKKILTRPQGMKGGILEVRTLFITCLEKHLEELVSAVEAAGVSIDDQDIVAGPIAESTVVLTKLQKKAGCVLANIGAETVSISVFEEGIPVSLQVFPIGSTNITNDIALGLKIPLEDAERVKKMRDEGHLKRKVDEIIEARLSDIFDLIEAHLKKIGKNGLLPAGIILTGGGSTVAMIEDLAKSSLRLPAKVATPKDVRELSWATAYGLCILGQDPDRGGDGFQGIKLVRQTGSSIVSWLKQFLP